MTPPTSRFGSDQPSGSWRSCGEHRRARRGLAGRKKTRCSQPLCRSEVFPSPCGGHEFSGTFAPKNKKEKNLCYNPSYANELKNILFLVNVNKLLKRNLSLKRIVIKKHLLKMIVNK